MCASAPRPCGLMAPGSLDGQGGIGAGRGGLLGILGGVGWGR